MEFSIDIHTNINGEIIIEDFSKEYGQYIPEELETIVSYDYYKYSQSVTLNCITKVSINSITLLDVLLNDHKEYLDSCTFHAKHDGYYVVEHIIIPNLEWYNQATPQYKEYYETIYVTDGEKLYKEVEGVLQECTIREIMERNVEGTTIKKCKIDVFFTGHLQECYINYCKGIFNNLLNKCESEKDSNIYARDFIWMTLNIIDYLIGFKQFMEAERLLKMFQSCGSFCNDKQLHGRKPGPVCGCS